MTHAGDHGKTTLVDALFRSRTCLGTTRRSQGVLDSNDQGTWHHHLAKNAAIDYKGVKVN